MKTKTNKKTLTLDRVCANAPLQRIGLMRAHILALCAGQSGMTPTTLAKRLGVTAAAITQQVNRLEENGMVKRYNDPEDRRVVSITITAKGCRIVEQINSKFVVA